MQRALLLTVLVAFFVGTALAGHKTWDNRNSYATESRLCNIDEQGVKSWDNRRAAERCATCSTRCYRAQFNASAETSGTPLGLCSTTDDKCEITIFIKTTPCCRCPEGHDENWHLHRELAPEDDYAVLTTCSYCEVPLFRVLVNGFWVLPWENDCNISQPAKFDQLSVADDSTVNSLQDCAEEHCGGSKLTQAYKKDYPRGNYPDPCFADKNWVESFASEHQGLIGSRFEMWRPNSAAKWFDRPLDRKSAPHEIHCSSIPKEFTPYVLLI